MADEPLARECSHTRATRRAWEAACGHVLAPRAAAPGAWALLDEDADAGQQLLVRCALSSIAFEMERWRSGHKGRLEPRGFFALSVVCAALRERLSPLSAYGALRAQAGALLRACEFAMGPIALPSGARTHLQGAMRARDGLSVRCGLHKILDPACGEYELPRGVQLHRWVRGLKAAVPEDCDDKDGEDGDDVVRELGSCRKAYNELWSEDSDVSDDDGEGAPDEGGALSDVEDMSVPREARERERERLQARMRDGYDGFDRGEWNEDGFNDDADGYDNWVATPRRRLPSALRLDVQTRMEDVYLDDVACEQLGRSASALRSARALMWSSYEIHTPPERVGTGPTPTVNVRERTLSMRLVAGWHPERRSSLLMQLAHLGPQCQHVLQPKYALADAQQRDKLRLDVAIEPHPREMVPTLSVPCDWQTRRPAEPTSRARLDRFRCKHHGVGACLECAAHYVGAREARRVLSGLTGLVHEHARPDAALMASAFERHVAEARSAAQLRLLATADALDAYHCARLCCAEVRRKVCQICDSATQADGPDAPNAPVAFQAPAACVGDDSFLREPRTCVRGGKVVRAVDAGDGTTLLAIVDCFATTGGLLPELRIERVSHADKQCAKRWTVCRTMLDADFSRDDCLRGEPSMPSLYEVAADCDMGSQAAKGRWSVIDLVAGPLQAVEALAPDGTAFLALPAELMDTLNNRMDINDASVRQMLQATRRSVRSRARNGGEQVHACVVVPRGDPWKREAARAGREHEDAVVDEDGQLDLDDAIEHWDSTCWCQLKPPLGCAGGLPLAPQSGWFADGSLELAVVWSPRRVSCQGEVRVSKMWQKVQGSTDNIWVEPNLQSNDTSSDGVPWWTSYREEEDMTDFGLGLSSVEMGFDPHHHVVDHADDAVLVRYRRETDAASGAVTYVEFGACPFRAHGAIPVQVAPVGDGGSAAVLFKIAWPEALNACPIVRNHGPQGLEMNADGDEQMDVGPLTAHAPTIYTEAGEVFNAYHPAAFCTEAQRRSIEGGNAANAANDADEAHDLDPWRTVHGQPGHPFDPHRAPGARAAAPDLWHGNENSCVCESLERRFVLWVSRSVAREPIPDADMEEDKERDKANRVETTFEDEEGQQDREDDDEFGRPDRHVAPTPVLMWRGMPQSPAHKIVGGSGLFGGRTAESWRTNDPDLVDSTHGLSSVERGHREIVDSTADDCATTAYRRVASLHLGIASIAVTRGDSGGLLLLCAYTFRPHEHDLDIEALESQGDGDRDGEADKARRDAGRTVALVDVVSFPAAQVDDAAPKCVSKGMRQEARGPVGASASHTAQGLGVEEHQVGCKGVPLRTLAVAGLHSVRWRSEHLARKEVAHGYVPTPSPCGRFLTVHSPAYGEGAYTFDLCDALGWRAAQPMHDLRIMSTWPMRTAATAPWPERTSRCLHVVDDEGEGVKVGRRHNRGGTAAWARRCVHATSELAMHCSRTYDNHAWRAPLRSVAWTASGIWLLLEDGAVGLLRESREQPETVRTHGGVSADALDARLEQWLERKLPGPSSDRIDPATVFMSIDAGPPLRVEAAERILYALRGPCKSRADLTTRYGDLLDLLED